MQKNKKTKKAGSNPVKRKKMALGKGLGALIPDIETEPEKNKDYFHCDTHLIRPNPFQPRRRFTDEDLAELSESIKTQGILQPLLVRQDESGYELITGERRLRAAKHAGLTQVPVLIKRVNNDKLLEMAIVENIQRENLNAIEIALSYQRLLSECELRQEDLGDRVGKKRSTVTNYLRLLKLPPDVQAGLRDGKIGMGHARALINIENIDYQETLANSMQSHNDWKTLIKTSELEENKKRKKKKTHQKKKHAYTILTGQGKRNSIT